jgi:hypothetical protein
MAKHSYTSARLDRAAVEITGGADPRRVRSELYSPSSLVVREPAPERPRGDARERQRALAPGAVAV